MIPSLHVSLLPTRLAVCQLEAGSPVPNWALAGDFYSITRTSDELSIVCTEQNVPAGTRTERGWRGLKVEGPLDFTLIGILASLARTLAGAGVSLFAISTFDTDYLLVKENDLSRAIQALKESGHQVDSHV
jgi:uncharacterized protein